MTTDVVVLGSGYAGAGAVKSLERRVGDEADITWISDVDHHFVLHEGHRIIRNPSVKEKVTIPVDEIKRPSTRFVKGRVDDLEAADKEVHLEDGSTVSYDYCVLAIGSSTAFFGIDGLQEHSLTLKSLEDALDIHDAVREAARGATRTDPAQVVIGGAGLSGIQSAGEIAEFRDIHRAPIDIHLVEGLDAVFPPGEPELQEKLRAMLTERDIKVHLGEFVNEVDEDTVHVGDEEMPYDVLLWTGGITGQEVCERLDCEKDERSNRVHASATFETDAPGVFALGDTALVAQDDDQDAPPTAQAAWQAAETVGENVARAMRNQPLTEWTYEDKGTLISVGEDAVAYDIEPVKGLKIPRRMFSGLPAETLKKGVAARWINRVTGPGRAAVAWPDM
jgi:NADH dehydrogenase